jgi:TPR repeat protein
MFWEKSRGSWWFAGVVAAVALSVVSQSFGDAPPAAALVYPRVAALCVGINGYKLDSIRPLSYAEDDARALTEVLDKQYGCDVTRLLGHQATRSAIRAKLESYRELGPDDALIVFFAGHGQTIRLENQQRTGFLVPYDARLDLDDTRNPDEWTQQAIDMREVEALVESLKCRHVLLLTDVCYSGFIGRRVDPADRTDSRKMFLGKSRMIITAGTEDQQALEAADLQHGIFSRAVLDSLKAGKILSASDLFFSVRSKVSKLSGGRMLPQMRDLVLHSGEFVFIPRGTDRLDVQAELDQISEQVAARGAASVKAAQLYEAIDAEDYRYALERPELEKQWQAKFKRLIDRASVGDGMAMACLYYSFRRGLGTDADEKQAYLWAERAFDEGLPEGKQVLGSALLHGVGVEQNRTAAVRLLSDAAATDPESGLVLAMDTLEAQSPPPAKLKIAMEQLDRAAAVGLPMAELARARVYLGELPSGVAPMTRPAKENSTTQPAALTQPEENPARAVELLLKAKQLPGAEYELALLDSGAVLDYRQVNLAEARELLRKSAEAGFPPAQTKLAEELYGAHIFKATMGLEQDFQEARRWAELAAKQGSSRADVILAVMYRFGEGVVADWDQSRQLLESAIAKNDPDAMLVKALRCSRGDGGFAKDEAASNALLERMGSMSPAQALRAARTFVDVSRKLKWYDAAAQDGTNATAGDELLFFVVQLHNPEDLMGADWDFDWFVRPVDPSAADRWDPEARQKYLYRMSEGRDKVAEEAISVYAYCIRTQWVRSQEHDPDAWLARARRCMDAPVLGEFGVAWEKPVKGPGFFAQFCVATAAAQGNAEAKSLISDRSKLAQWYEARAEVYRQRGMTRDAAWASDVAVKLRAPRNTEPAK